MVLAFAPPEIADVPVRLAALARDAEAAARIHHPNLVPALGLETVGDAVALAAAHVDGAALEALLSAGGRLPPDVAARIVCDAGAGLAALHAVDAGDGQPLAHGALSPAWITVGDDGVTRVAGAGAGGGVGGPVEDVRALAAILHRCLSGEPPSTPPRPLDGPGIPRALAAVVDGALVPVAGTAAPSAAALVEEIAGALPLAPSEHVSAYLEAIAPERPERAALAARLAEADGGIAGPPPVEPERAADADELIVAEPEIAPGAEEAPAWAVATTASIRVLAVSGDAATNTGATNVAVTNATATASADAANAIATANAVRIADVATSGNANATATANANALVNALVNANALANANSATRPNATMSALPDADAGAFPNAGAIPTPLPYRPPPPDAAITFPVPLPAASRSRLPLLAGVAGVALGFVLGVAAVRLLGIEGIEIVRRPREVASPEPDAATTAATAPAPASTLALPPSAPAPARAAAAPSAAQPAAPSTPPGPPSRRPAPPSLAISADPPVNVFVDGKLVGRPPLTVPVAPGDHDVRLRDPAQGIDVRRRVSARGPATPVRFALGRGVLSVTAPPDTEVLVDGRHAGRGDLRVELWEGAHRVEARRGEAKVTQQFSIRPHETWTYDITPTP